MPTFVEWLQFQPHKNAFTFDEHWVSARRPNNLKELYGLCCKEAEKILLATKSSKFNWNNKDTLLSLHRFCSFKEDLEVTLWNSFSKSSASQNPQITWLNQLKASSSWKNNCLIGLQYLLKPPEGDTMITLRSHNGILLYFCHFILSNKSWTATK